MCAYHVHISSYVYEWDSQGVYYLCVCVCVWMCLHATVCFSPKCSCICLQGGIYLFVHKRVGWSICVIYVMFFFYLHVVEAVCTCVLVCAHVCVHILQQLHREYTVLRCVTDRAMCLGAADAVHIWWGIQPAVCSLIWHGMIQAITHTQRHRLTHTASMPRPPSRTQESPHYTHTHTSTQTHIHTLIKHTDRKT